MLQLTLDQIPEFLKSSQLFEMMDFNDYDSEFVYVLEENFKTTLSVENDDDFVHLLKTNDYWMVKDVPFTMYDYVRSVPDYKEWKKNLLMSNPRLNLSDFDEIYKAETKCVYIADQDFIEESNYESEYDDFFRKFNDFQNQTAYMALTGNLTGLKYYVERQINPIDNLPVAMAIYSKNTVAFNYLMDCGYPILDEYVALMAAYSNDVSVLKRLYEEGFIYANDVDMYPAELLALTLFNNSIEATNFLHEKGFVLTMIGRDLCISKENQEVYELVFGNNQDMLIYGMISARSIPSLKMIKYFHKKGVELGPMTMRTNVITDLDCLKYVHENGCPFDINTVYQTIAYSDIDCVKYVIENGGFCGTDLLEFAAENDFPECIKYLRTLNYQWNINVSVAATKNEDLDVLKYIHKNGCPWDIRTSMAAAENQNMEILKYCHENGCPWDESVVNTAAKKGCIETLKYAIDNGCPHNNSVIDYAMCSFTIKPLKFLYQRGYTWTENSLRSAFDACNIENFIFALSRNCPYKEELFLEIKNSTEPNKKEFFRTLKEEIIRVKQISDKKTDSLKRKSDEMS